MSGDFNARNRDDAEKTRRHYKIKKCFSFSGANLEGLFIFRIAVVNLNNLLKELISVRQSVSPSVCHALKKTVFAQKQLTLGHPVFLK